MYQFYTSSIAYTRRLVAISIAAVLLLVLLACSVDAQQLAGAAVEEQAPSQTVAPAAATPTNLTVVNWGQSLPSNLEDVVAVAAGYEHSVALKRDGTVVSWGKTPPTPAGLNNVVAIAAGRYGTLALKSDGTLVAWGSANFGQLDVPAGLSGVVGMAMGDTHSVAVKQDGTVVVWGRSLNPKLNAPAGLSDVVAVSASMSYNLGLKRDGTVVAWGMSGGNWLNVPAGLNNVVAVVASQSGALALKGDGTVVAWGGSASTNPPAGLTDIIAIDADQYQVVALKRDGTIVKWGALYLQGIPEYVKGVTAVALGFEHTLLLMADNTAPETRLYQGPTAFSSDAVTFQFDGNDDLALNGIQLRYECSLGGGEFTSCTSPATYTDVAGGPQTFAVRAKDAAGNVDASPATYEWMACGNGLDAGDEAGLTLGLTCFNQRTTPGVFTIRMTNDIDLSATPIAENATANVSLLIDGQDHTWHGQGLGGQAVHGLHVKPGTTVTVQNLTIHNTASQSSEAGAIYNQGNLTVEHITLDGNYSLSVGGGIGNHGTLTVRNSSIRNNRASGYGGGIGNWTGTATIENSSITSNYGYFGGGLYNNQRATTNLSNVIFAGNNAWQGSDISNSYGGTINGQPTYAPICYWLENYTTQQVLTIPNQSSTAGTALVAAAKQTPTNGHQLWVRRADNALVSLPTGQWLTVSEETVDGLTPAVIEPETAGAASQHWNIPTYMGGFDTFGSLLNGYYLSPVDQTVEQTPVVLRHPDDFRYNNWQNNRNKWLVNEAPPLDCLAAVPVSAASAENAATISEIEAPASPDQLPADAMEKFNAALQPDPVTVEDPNVPTEAPASATEAPASAEENIQTQRIFLPLVTK